MRLAFTRLSLLFLSTLALTACDDPAMMGVQQPAAVVPAAPEATVDPALYAARKDGNFTIPAVPVEKLNPANARQLVAYPTDQPVGTIIINPSERFLYLVTAQNQAMRYGISVGRAGFEWHGEAIISSRRSWPTWTPPPEMIDRDPKLEKWRGGQPGGPSNPLGARALYLTTNGRDYGYRIHGTPDWWSIGRNASSGCIRMIHQDVIDLAERVPNGTKVVVLTRDGQLPKGLKVPPPAPRKPKPAEALPAVVAQPTPTEPTAEGLATPAIPVTEAAPQTLPQPVALPTGQSPTATSTVGVPLTGDSAAGSVATPAPVVTAPAAASLPTATPLDGAIPAPSDGTCKVALVNGTCPQP